LEELRALLIREHAWRQRDVLGSHSLTSDSAFAHAPSPPDNVSALGWPNLLIPLYAPVAALIGGCLAWVVLAFSKSAVAALRGGWLVRAVVAVQLALLAAAWLLFSTAPNSGSEGCADFTNVWWLHLGVLLAACGAGAVAIARAFALEGDAGLTRLGLVVLGLVMPYATTLVLTQDAFCGWN